MDWAALQVTLRLALSTTAVLLVIGLPLAYWLSSSRWRFKFILEALVALPILLPPTVLGFYLLMATGPNSVVGGFVQRLFGRALPFTFWGILIGSTFYNLPFAVRPFIAAFNGVDRRLVEASWSLGVSRFKTFFRMILPLAWPGILTGMVLTFAHTVGEFGVVLMVGGNIPEVTRTLSITIYDHVQALDYQGAYAMALVLLLFSFSVLCGLQWVQKKGVPV